MTDGDRGAHGGAGAAAVPILEVRGLIAGYGGAPVLHDVDLDVPTGSITAVLGANGAGKTTLLRTLSGLIRPTRRRRSCSTARACAAYRSSSWCGAAWPTCPRVAAWSPS